MEFRRVLFRSITGRKFSEPARQAIDGLAPTNVACPDRLAREKPTVEPDTKVRPLLARGVPRSFHCPAKRKRCSMCIAQSQIIHLGSDQDVLKVAITNPRPQPGLECRGSQERSVGKECASQSSTGWCT